MINVIENAIMDFNLKFQKKAEAWNMMHGPSSLWRAELKPLIEDEMSSPGENVKEEYIIAFMHIKTQYLSLIPTKPRVISKAPRSSRITPISGCVGMKENDLDSRLRDKQEQGNSRLFEWGRQTVPAPPAWATRRIMRMEDLS